MANFEYKLTETVKDAKAYWNAAVTYLNGATVGVAGVVATFTSFLEPKIAAIIAAVSGVVSLVQKFIIDKLNK